ncbi:oligopeptide/dipeptide ABC transporter ATP-binding protein [Nonomuraea sp. NPDC004297]
MVRHISDRVAVMYLGKVVELGERAQVYDRPRHPYTRALLEAVPIPDPVGRDERVRVLLAGDPPSPVDPPSGCRFRTRCPKAEDLCAVTEPALVVEATPQTEAACHFPDHTPLARLGA